MSTDMQLPLVLGITGHRDPVPEDIPSLEARVREIISTLRQKYPQTPLILLSPLAEGADRLVANVALEEGVTLIAPLPFEIDEYRKDFQTETSRKEFDELLARAERKIILPWNGEDRDNQYLAVGQFVVEYSQIMIALWNGDDNGLPGGTASIAKLQLQGNTEVSMQISSSFAPLQTGVVYHVLTRRITDTAVKAEYQLYQAAIQNGAVVQTTPCSLNILYPFNSDRRLSMQDELERMFDCLNEFNSDLIDNREEIGEKIPQSKEWFFPESECADEYLRSLRELFALCDSFAMVCQARSHSTLLTIASTLPLIIFFLSVFTNAITSIWVALLYLLLMIFVYAMYRISAKRGDQKNYLDCRALAEGLRVHFFWKLAGLDESAADHLLSRERSEVDWIRCAIKTWDLTYGGINYNRTITAGDISVIKKFWVVDQQNFFVKRYQSENNTNLELEFISGGFFKMAMFAIMPLLIVIHGFEMGGKLLDKWIMVAMPVVITISIAIAYYNERRLFEFHARQYQRMAALFGKGYTALELSINNMKMCQNIIYKLGCEALVENSDWLLMHRERPVDVPKG